jgi:hypothetical protein
MVSEFGDCSNIAQKRKWFARKNVTAINFSMNNSLNALPAILRIK